MTDLTIPQQLSCFILKNVGIADLYKGLTDQLLYGMFGSVSAKVCYWDNSKILQM